MIKLNVHARIEIALAALLLLGSCGADAPRRFTEGDYDRLDVVDVNARANSLESRVSDIEQRLGM